MAVEFDHVFICASPAGHEAGGLTTFGLQEGTPNTHPGQGTACRRFFFRNAYLELLWVSDMAEAKSDTIRPTHLWERWTGRSQGACPFGFGFRPAKEHNGGPPFPAWDYRPPYLPDSMSFQVATNADVLIEPMLFYLGHRPDSHPSSSSRRQVMEHTPPLKEITRITFVIPHAGSHSAALEAVSRAGLMRVAAGSEYFTELGFDGELQGQKTDFRPHLPLAFCW